MKVLFFGDIVGRIGRQALLMVLPGLKKKYQPDFIVANGENLAHGKGITQVTVDEVINSGVDLLTSGNHISDKAAFKDIVDVDKPCVIRPANFPPLVPGRGWVVLRDKIAVVNLMGRVFFRENLDDPFRKLDAVLEEIGSAWPKQIPVIVDWHTEATSEKAALAWYADGRVAAVLGTHTHVPTADAKILPQGTAFVSDVGMVGAKDSILGFGITEPLLTFQTQLAQRYDVPESGLVQVNAVLVTISEASKQATKIERLDTEVNVTGS